jgi:hypothetical protein
MTSRRTTCAAWPGGRKTPTRREGCWRHDGMDREEAARGPGRGGGPFLYKVGWHTTRKLKLPNNLTRSAATGLPGAQCSRKHLAIVASDLSIKATSMPLSSPGASFSLRRIALHPSQRANGPPSANRYEVWYIFAAASGISPARVKRDDLALTRTAQSQCEHTC